MTFWPLLLSTLLYVWTSVGFFKTGNPGLGIAFCGYAAANVGFLLIAAK